MNPSIPPYIAEKIEEFRSFFDWAPQIKAQEEQRWELMYGCKPQRLLEEIESALISAHQKGVEEGKEECLRKDIKDLQAVLDEPHVEMEWRINEIQAIIWLKGRELMKIDQSRHES